MFGLYSYVRFKTIVKLLHVNGITLYVGRSNSNYIHFKPFIFYIHVKVHRCIDDSCIRCQL